MLCFCFRLLLKSSTKSARRKDKWNFIRKYKTEFSDQSIWKSYNEEHIIIIIAKSTFENMFCNSDKFGRLHFHNFPTHAAKNGLFSLLNIYMQNMTAQDHSQRNSTSKTRLEDMKVFLRILSLTIEVQENLCWWTLYVKKG